MNPLRINHLNQHKYQKGIVVYWMNRDFRLHSNHALYYASQLAKQKNQPFIVLVHYNPVAFNGNIRQINNFLNIAHNLKENFEAEGINYIITNKPFEDLIEFLFNEIKIGAFISDFNPLLHYRNAVGKIARNAHSIPCAVVDTHNIVPCFVASTKQEYGAYTLRPKIHRLLLDFLADLPEKSYDYKNNPNIISEFSVSAPDKKHICLKTDPKELNELINAFIEEKLPYYSELKNDPNADMVSGFSPYLHFGLMSAQDIGISIIKTKQKKDIGKDFLEELIVRKELSDNFCYYNDAYDKTDGFPDWAKATLNVHRSDEREYLYNLEEFENFKTHDPLWNKAQQNLVNTGKMHGYLRMYWAKKILEWSASPEDAINTAIFLNDHYALDGNDPNGYTGIAWSIGGVHDRPWSERHVFGKIRYMNFNGCKRKFDVEKYIHSSTSLDF